MPGEGFEPGVVALLPSDHADGDVGESKSPPPFYNLHVLHGCVRMYSKQFAKPVGVTLAGEQTTSSGLRIIHDPVLFGEFGLAPSGTALDIEKKVSINQPTRFRPGLG